jgi:uncharacterized protein (TIGR03118 family)
VYSTRLYKFVFTSIALALMMLSIEGGAAIAAPPIFYKQTNLISDEAGKAALPDDNLLNAWGMAFQPNGAIWVNDNHSGVATLYDGLGAIQTLVVTVPPPIGNDAQATPTGMVANAFKSNAPGNNFDGDIFIFATEDGTISGWQGSLGKEAAIRRDNSEDNSIYKGLAQGVTRDGRPHIYATDFHNGAIDVFDSSYMPVTLNGKFEDPFLPKRYAPFGIANLNGQLYVSYAQQDDDAEDDVKGTGHGFIDIFTTDGFFVRRFASRGFLNSPWGLAIAPAEFGIASGKLLVGNQGNGHIPVFDPATGLSLGELLTRNGLQITPLVIDGLWKIMDGDGALNAPANTMYFSAGPNAEADGLFGTVTPDQQ